MIQKITRWVVSIHICLILFLSFSQKTKKKRPSIAVHTVTQKPLKNQTSFTKKTNTIPGNQTQKKSSTPSSVTKTTTKPSPQRSQKKPSTPPIQKATPSKIYKEIDEALEKIDKILYSTSNTPQEALNVQTLSNVEISFFDTEKSYYELSRFLKNVLTLPESGEVTAEITITETGMVEKVVIIKTNSKKNKEYLEKKLPLLQLPQIPQNKKKLTLIFCNEH